MTDLGQKASELGRRLADLDAHHVELALASAGAMFEADPSESNGFALVGAIMVAEATVEQLKSQDPPFALDGDVHFASRSWPPGRRLDAFVKQLQEAEVQAVIQRRTVLRQAFHNILDVESAP